jgi:deoxycytidine triphosphate deaminase
MEGENQGGLITPFDENQLVALEGSAYDLRIDKVFEFPILDGVHWKETVPFIGQDYRRTPPIVERQPEDHMIMVDRSSHSQSFKKLPVEFTGWHIEGVRSYLIQTVESVNIPSHLFGMCDSRTTVFRSAAWLFATPVRPGYSGVLTFGLHVSSLDGIYFERGARVASIMFGRLGPGETGKYKGQWGQHGGNKPGTNGQVTKGF